MAYTLPVTLLQGSVYADFFTINVVYLRFPSGNLFYLSTELMSKEKRLNQKTKPVQSLFLIIHLNYYLVKSPSSSDGKLSIPI